MTKRDDKSSAHEKEEKVIHSKRLFNNKNSSQNKTLTASLKNGTILALFALVSTGLIAIIHVLTKDKIAFEIEAAMVRQLNQIVDRTEYDNDVQHDCIMIKNSDLLGLTNAAKIYRMRSKGKNYGLFLPLIAPDGYAGKISLVLGIYENGTIAGLRVTEHMETPGLGDKIEIDKSNWIKQFNGKSLDNLETSGWNVKKDGGNFDALTGATITPRAIVKAVYRSLQYYQNNKQVLYSTFESTNFGIDNVENTHFDNCENKK